MKSIKQIYHTKEFKKILRIIIVCLVMGFLIGFYSGVQITIDKIARVASGFIDIDKDLIKQAIYQYEHNIGICYPPK